MNCIDKVLTDEEIDNLVNEIMNIPIEKNNNCLSTYGSVNVDELISVVKEMQKIPTYDNLLKENQKLKEAINKAIEELYIWGEILNPEFQKKMLEILETE